MRMSDNLAGTTPSFFGRMDNGLIEFDPADTSVVANPAMQTILNRPATSNAFLSAKRSGPIRLGPGHIKKSVWKWERKLSFPAFQRVLQNRFRLGSEAITYVSLGKFEFIGFEKLVRTYVNTGDTNPVSVGYELNQIIGAYCSLKRRGIPRTQLVIT